MKPRNSHPLFCEDTMKGPYSVSVWILHPSQQEYWKLQCRYV